MAHGAAGSTCTFDLLGSKETVALHATVNDPSVPASVLTMVDPTDSDYRLRYVQVGQMVTDTHGCSSGLRLTRVWPAKGLIYLSGPVACTGINSYLFTFQDHSNQSITPSCALTGDDPTPGGSNVGCAQVDPNFRWGDGIRMAANRVVIRDADIRDFATCFRGEVRDLTLEDCRGVCTADFAVKTSEAPFISNVRITPPHASLSLN